MRIISVWDWLCRECGAGTFRREGKCSTCGHVGTALPASEWRRCRAWLEHKGFRVIDGGKRDAA